MRIRWVVDQLDTLFLEVVGHIRLNKNSMRKKIVFIIVLKRSNRALGIDSATGNCLHSMKIMKRIEWQTRILLQLN
jgi:hypothetical protein